MRNDLLKKGLVFFVFLIIIVCNFSAPGVKIEKKDNISIMANNVPPFEDPPNELWNKTFGGNDYDSASFVQQTNDGGYIITGGTGSYSSGSGGDVWLIKTDIDGNEEWNKTIGGPNSDGGSCVKITNDGGFIIAGTYAHSSSGPWDIWIIKTDENGNMSWEEKFSDSLYNTYGHSIVELDDGYIVMGVISIMDFPNIRSDIWLIKTDLNGNEQWNKTIGDNNRDDDGNSLIVTHDGDFVIVGQTFSYLLGNKVLLIKTDSNGNKLWRKELDGEDGTSIIETDDGDYVITGRDGVCLIKTDENGNMIWKQDYGWGGFDLALSVDHASDGGYIVSGNVLIGGEADALFIKTDENGNREWEKTMGGVAPDGARCIIQSNDDTYVAVGFSVSYGNAYDAWLIKLAPFDNHRPNKPTINGPTEGIPGEQYTYSLSTTDNDDNNVLYWIEWGDFYIDGWLGPYDSGGTCEASHSWLIKGIFKIQVKARDIYGGDSDWGTLTVTMPRDKVLANSLLLKLLDQFLLLEVFISRLINL